MDSVKVYLFSVLNFEISDFTVMGSFFNPLTRFWVKGLLNYQHQG